MVYRTKMASNKNSVTVAFILGVCLLQAASASTSIDLVAYNGVVGHATSYNYPFKHTYNTDKYTYRLFTDSASAQKLCLTFRRFEMTYTSRFIIKVKTSGGSMQYYDYTRHGERVNQSPNSPLPDNIWNQPFCVNLRGYKFLMFTFYPQSRIQLSGFYLEYQTTTPQKNVNSMPPCGSGYFTCYNRECVNDSYVCTDKAACADMSHNTFAHAFCKSSHGWFNPVQQSGFWANNLDMGNMDGITMDHGWIHNDKVVAPSVGPPSDHTGGGKFLHTRFSSTRYDLKLTFSPGKLVQKENCLSFWYYMYGRDPGELVAEWGLTKVWQRAGSYSAKWLQAQANLFCESGLGCDQKIKITASRASNPDTRISIDDISVMPGLCPFYEADIIPAAWTTDDGCSFINGRLTCSSLSASSAHTKSWLVSRGKCLLGDVVFDFNTNPEQTVMVFKYPVVDRSGVHLKTLRQSTPNQRLPFKIPLELSVPAKIGFTTIFNKGRISLENIHVVDNECDNLGFVDVESTTVYPFTRPTAIPPHADSPNSSLTISGIVIGVIVAVCVSVISVGIFLHQRYCKKPQPQRHAQTQPHTPPAYGECVPPTAPHLGQVSNLSQPPPYTILI